MPMNIQVVIYLALRSFEMAIPRIIKHNDVCFTELNFPEKFNRMNGSHREGCWLFVCMMQLVEMLKDKHSYQVGVRFSFISIKQSSLLSVRLKLNISVTAELIGLYYSGKIPTGPVMV